MTHAVLAALLDRERMLRDTIINVSPNGVLLLNARTWSCEMVNPALQKLAGPALDVGVTLADGWPEALPGLTPLLAESLTSDHVVKGDLELRMPSSGSGPSRVLHLMVSATRIEPEEGDSIVLVVLTDVTEQAELQGQLLQAITGYTELAAANLPSGERSRSMLLQKRKSGCGLRWKPRDSASGKPIFRQRSSIGRRRVKFCTA